MKRFILLLLFSGVIIGCGPSITDNNEDNQMIEEETKYFYRLDLTTVDTGLNDCNYKELVFKDKTHYVLIEKYDNGITKTELFVNDKDTVAVLASPNGFPEAIINRDETILLGGYNGNRLRCCVITKDGPSQVFDLETKTNWDDFYEFMVSSPQTKASDDETLNNEDKIKQATIDKIIGDIVSAILTKKIPAAKLLNDLSYVLEVDGLMLSDNDEWVKWVESTADAVYYTSLGLAIIAAPEATAISLFTAYVIGRVYEALRKQFKTESEDYQFAYNEVFDAVLSQTEINCDWLGGPFFLEVNPGRTYYDVYHLKWYLVSEQPKWVKVSLNYSEQKHSMMVIVDKNDELEPRSHEIVIVLEDIVGDQKEVTLTINQGTQLRVDPTYLFFEKKETKEITVYSTDPWDFYGDIPEWVDVRRVGLGTSNTNKIQVTLKEEGVYHIGKLYLEAMSREGEKYYASVTLESSLIMEEEGLRQKLIQFYKDTGGPNWKHNENWCSEKPITQWYGIGKHYGYPGYDLYLANNNLKGSGSLAKCPFVIVSLQENNISRLDLAGCSILSELRCTNSHLHLINIDGCLRLSQVELSFNELQSFDISGNTYLSSLGLSVNRLTSLNVSGCTSLSELSCDRNESLGSLDVSTCTYLSVLDCRMCGLSSLGLCPNVKYYWLLCSNNPYLIKEFPSSLIVTHIFEYDQRYIYHGWDENGNPIFTDRGYGWYYPGEPEKGYHGW